MEIRNITDQPLEITVDGFEHLVDAGATVDVPDEVANGEPARGEPDEPGYYPGTTGLVGTGKFEHVTKRKQTGAPASDDPPSGEEE